MSSSEYLKYAFEKIVLMDDPISKMLILNGFAQNTQNLTLNYLIQYAISFLKDVSDFLKEILLSLTASHAYSTDFNNVMSSVSQYFHALKEKEMQCNQIVYCFASIESLFFPEIIVQSTTEETGHCETQTQVKSPADKVRLIVQNLQSYRQLLVDPKNQKVLVDFSAVCQDSAFSFFPLNPSEFLTKILTMIPNIHSNLLEERDINFDFIQDLSSFRQLLNDSSVMFTLSFFSSICQIPTNSFSDMLPSHFLLLVVEMIQKFILIYGESINRIDFLEKELIMIKT